MKPSTAISALVLTRFLISDVSCVSVTVESSLVRSETKPQKDEPVKLQLELQPSGSMQPSREGGSSKVGKPMCELDWPLGPEGGCKCTDEAKHNLILEEDECMEAARQAGVSAPFLTFRLHSEWYDHHPKGCFKQTCSEDPKGICYFFNPVGDNPAQCRNQTKLTNGEDAPKVTGQPVCKREKYLNGTTNANDGCPTGYQNIMDADYCAEAANCIGITAGSEFRVTSKNQSRHDDFPNGCFVDNRDGKVYFNPPLENWEPPKSPVGTPLCNNSESTFFKGKAGAGDTDMSARAGEASTATTTTTTAAPAI